MTDTPATETKISTATEVAEKLDRAGLRLDISPGTARLIVRALRRLAEGRPVSMEEIAELASDLDNADEAVSLIDQMSEKDGDGNIVGHMGLSLNDHPHKFEVDGHELRTWCAWDTLFLPALLGQTAHVVSKDPASGEEVRLKVAPAGVERTRPDEILVSIVFPQSEGEAWSAERAQALFCSFVHFFTDREAAARWFAERNMPVSFITVDEAVKLGRIRFANIIAQT